MGVFINADGSGETVLSCKVGTL